MLAQYEIRPLAYFFPLSRHRNEGRGVRCREVPEYRMNGNLGEMFDIPSQGRAHRT
jgi:hypothetical protein